MLRFNAHVSPPSVDVVNFRCSWFRPAPPSTQARTIWSVAPEPLGELLAMSTDGATDRSSRAPASPSITNRPCTGSYTPVWWTGNSFLAPSNVAPPSNERSR